MKNTTLLFMIALALVAAGIFLWQEETHGPLPLPDRVISGGVIQEGMVSSSETGAQDLRLSIKDGNYYPQVLEVKKGRMVRLTLDSSVKGCFRSLTIKNLNIFEYSPTPSKRIEFTPDKEGTFVFACSMGMGYGKLVVS